VIYKTVLHDLSVLAIHRTTQIKQPTNKNYYELLATKWQFV